jgi:predicted metal-dependent hydrolase
MPTPSAFRPKLPLGNPACTNLSLPPLRTSPAVPVISRGELPATDFSILFTFYFKMTSDFSFSQVQIVYSKRRTIVLQVKAGHVFLKAPVRTPTKYLEDLISKKQHWIMAKLELSQKTTQTKQKNLDPIVVSQYKAELIEYLNFKLSIFATQIGVTFNKFTVKKIHSRWGSCSVRGNLNFSLYLWNTPSFVIDYVIVHELCHLKHMNHSKAFWDLVGANYPQYQLAQSWLKTNGKSVM